MYPMTPVCQVNATHRVQLPLPSSPMARFFILLLIALLPMRGWVYERMV